MCIALLYDVSTSRVSLQYRLVMIIMRCLRFFVSRNGVRLSIALRFSALLAGESIKCCICVILASLRSHLHNRSLFLYIPLAI